MFHISLLRPYVDSGRVAPPPSPEIIQGETEYEVEEVLGHRDVGTGKEPNDSIWWNSSGKVTGHEHYSWEPLREPWQLRESNPKRLGRNKS